MNLPSRGENGRAPWHAVALGIARGTVMSFYEHWALALFSLIAAFGIWFVIQDVENPRVQAFFPPEGEPPSIPVQPVNADRLIPNDSYEVQVVVEGREDDLARTSAQDFEATIDVKGIPANSPTTVPVRVSAPEGVKVLRVIPSNITVTLEPVAEQVVEVRVNPSGQLAAGLEIRDVEIEPIEVTVSGLAEQLDLVASVTLDVNLSALNEGTIPVEGALTARTATNTALNVAISPPRGKATYTISQEFVQRSLSVRLATAGQVAAGYRTGNITIEPPIISASGPADRMPTELVTEPIQLGNAKSEIRLVANIALPQNANLSLERNQVSVRIEVKPIECTGVTNSPCAPLTLPVAPGVSDSPFAITSPIPIRVYVTLTGPLPVLDTLTANPGQITATIQLAGAVAGQGAFPVTVSIPTNLANQGVRAEPVPPVTLTLSGP